MRIRPAWQWPADVKIIRKKRSEVGKKPARERHHLREETLVRELEHRRKLREL